MCLPSESGPHGTLYRALHSGMRTRMGKKNGHLYVSPVEWHRGKVDKVHSTRRSSVLPVTVAVREAESNRSPDMSTEGNRRR